MAPLSLIDDTDLSLKRGLWVDTRCLAQVECVNRRSCHGNAIEPTRGPLVTKNAFSELPLTAPKSDAHTDFGEKRRRRVAFSAVVGVREIPHLKDMSDQELVDIWWTPNDYLLIRKMLRITVQFMAKGERFSSEDKDFCARGCDLHTRAGSLRHQRHRQRAVGAVLRAQDFQRAEAFTDSEYIAELYSECCHSSCEDARNRGDADANEVMNIDC